jgi:hypothetical protein
MVLSREPERKVSSAGFMQRVTTLYRIIIPGHLTLPGNAGGSFGAGRELAQGAERIGIKDTPIHSGNHSPWREEGEWEKRKQ